MRFGDDGAAMKANLHRAAAVACRKKRPRNERSRTAVKIIESEDAIGGTRFKAAKRFVQQARSAPRRSVVVLISERTAAHPNAQIVPIKEPTAASVHKHVRDGSVAACEGDSRGVRSAGGKSDVRLATTGNSGIQRSNVFGVGAGKQGRKGNV